MAWSNLVQSGRRALDQGTRRFWCEASSIKRPSSSLLDSKSSSTLISISNSILNTFKHFTLPKPTLAKPTLPTQLHSKCSSPRSPPSSPWPPQPSPLPLPATTRSSLALAVATTATISPPALLRARTFAVTVSAVWSRFLAPVAPPPLTAASLTPLWPWVPSSTSTPSTVSRFSN